MELCVFGYHEHEPMAIHHEHEHHHDHRLIDKRVLAIGLAITFVAMLVEFVAGFLANSLALVSDAIHMFTHAFALGLSLVAILLASKSAPLEKTFGYHRMEVLAAFVNGLTIMLSVGWILYEALERFYSPQAIEAQMTIWVALFGLIVNVATGLVLARGDRQNINIKSAFLHMAADSLSSVAIVIGATVILYTGWYIIDPILALLVAAVIGRWAWGLIKDSGNVLLETSPVRIEEVKSFIEQNYKEIADVHDIHIWEITHGMYILSAHILIEKEALSCYSELIDSLQKALKGEFGIVHTTFQPEWRG